MMLWWSRGFEKTQGRSHELLRRAVAEYTGDEERADALVSRMTKSGEFGKPVIEGFSHFSISHSGDMWAVLIADSPCGLDIQYPRDCDEAAIEERFYAPEDRGSGDFFRVWTRREALVKAAGTSAAASDIPSVSGDEAEYMGAVWRLADIVIPGCADLRAAVCIQADAGLDAHQQTLTEIRELPFIESA